MRATAIANIFPEGWSKRGITLFSASAAVSVLLFSIFFDFRIVLLLSAVIAFGVFLTKPSAVVYVLVTFAFLRLDAWISSLLSVPFGKLLFAFALLMIFAALTLTSMKFNRVSKPVALYTAFLVVYFLIGAVNADGRSMRLWFFDTIYAFTFFFALYIFINSYRRLERVIYLLMFLGVVTSAMNVYEFFHPYSLALSHSMGRSAGLLKNANTSAFVVNVSFIASFYVLRTVSSMRRGLMIVLLQALYFLGVFTTFSREGLMVFSAVFVIQLLSLSKRKVAVSIAVLLVIFIGVAASVHYIENGAAKDVQMSFTKISSLVQGQVDDNDRLFLLFYHLKRFSLHPLTGNGLYSALSYSVPLPGKPGTEVPNGPHNTFVFIMSEAGIFPFLLYSAFLIMVGLRLRSGPDIELLDGGYRRAEAMRSTLLILFFALFIHNFFSHMMTLSRYSMTLLALMSLPRRVRSPGR